ncbi:MAG: dihydropteroate synthase [Firmicutes bacterium]|nr:dihydropteroate synthase [Bacillota bacterium]
MQTITVRTIKVDNLREANALLRRVGADPRGVAIMAPKAVSRVLYLNSVPVHVAHILKQEMLASGGDAAVHRGVITGEVEQTDVVLLGTLKQLQQLVIKLKTQPYFRLPQLAEQIDTVLTVVESSPKGGLNCRGKWLPLGRRTLVMGILNLTPDSFSDGGKFNHPEAALVQARRLVEDGADILDVGAESTRPNATPVPAEEELRRIKPVLSQLLAEIDVPISVDTYKAKVAHEVLAMGVQMINDVGGLKFDPELARVVADYRVPVVIMHNRARAEYQDLMSELVADLRQSLELASRAGIAEEQIILDPGIGFGKTQQHNLEILRRLGELRVLGKPLLLGTSRKSFIGATLNLPVTERMEGTAATVALGIANGVDIVRVHDVKEMVRVARMTDAIVRGDGDD